MIFVCVCVSPGSFYWRMVFRNRGLVLGGLIASRLSQWTELENILITHIWICLCCIYLYVLKNISFHNDAFDSHVIPQRSFQPSPFLTCNILSHSEKPSSHVQ